MQIFLSYASEDKAVAEPIAFSLRSRGHKVFLDRDDLPAGGEYDRRIEQAVEQAGLVIFLLTPASVAKGRFTLTELEFARRKWRKADGHVLPVMVAPTPIADVPGFLKSVTILEPKGNVAAEVASAVASMTGDRDRRTYYVLGGLCLLSGLLTDPLQSALQPIVGTATIHNEISVDRWLSGLAFGIALLAGFAFLVRFRASMLLIPAVVLISFFLAMETWSYAAPIFDRNGGATVVDTADLRTRCAELASSTVPATDPLLKQACDALEASDAQGSTLSRLQSLPNVAIVYGLAGIVGAVLTYLGTMLALGRSIAAGGALVLSAVGGIAAAVVGMILAQADSPLRRCSSRPGSLWSAWRSAGSRGESSTSRCDGPRQQTTDAPDILLSGERAVISRLSPLSPFPP